MAVSTVNVTYLLSDCLVCHPHHTGKVLNTQPFKGRTIFKMKGLVSG
jgi:hypothetical protein